MSASAAVDPTAAHLHVDLAGRPLVVDLRDPVAAAAVGPALAPWTSAPRAGGARLRVWCDDDHPHPLWSPDPTGPIRIGAHGLAMSRPVPPGLEVFDPAVGLELWGTHDGLAAGDTRAHPAGHAIAAWLATTGALVLHVGGVAFRGRAVMVVGSGGAGKSTTTLAGALAGAEFLGDDLCAVDVDEKSGSVTLHALFATAKLNPDTDARLGLEHWTALGTTPKGKRVVSVAPYVQVRASAPVGAIVVLGPPGGDPETPVRMPRREVVRALAPTALVAAQGAGGLERWFATARAVARLVPAFAYAPSWDLTRVVDGLASTIEPDA